MVPIGFSRALSVKQYQESVCHKQVNEMLVSDLLILLIVCLLLIDLYSFDDLVLKYCRIKRRVRLTLGDISKLLKIN